MSFVQLHAGWIQKVVKISIALQNWEKSPAQQPFRVIQH